MAFARHVQDAKANKKPGYWRLDLQLKKVEETIADPAVKMIFQKHRLAMLSECNALRGPTASTPINENIQSCEYDFPNSPVRKIHDISGIEELH